MGLKSLSDFAQQQFEAARQAIHEQQAELAILHLQMALNTDPDSDALHFLLLDCLLASGQAEAALEHLQAHHSLLSGQATFYFQQGQAWQQLQQDTEALAAFRQGVQRFPGHVPAHLALAQIYQAQGDAVGALAHYQMAARLKPEDSDLQMRLAFMLQQAGKHAEAQPLYLKVYTHSPDRADALYYWLQSQRLERSGDILQALIELAHQAPHLKRQLALHAFSVMYTAGEAEEARRSLAMALESFELENRGAYALMQQLIAPLIPPAASGLAAYQSQIVQALQTLKLPDKPLIYSDYSNLEPYLQLWEPLSYLPFFNLDPLQPRQLLGRFFQRCLPALSFEEMRQALAGTHSKPKIGIVFSQSQAAEFFWHDTLLHWPRDVQDISLLYLPPASPPPALSTYRSDFECVLLPAEPEAQLSILRQAGFDLLFFTELMTAQLAQTFLAAHRLAPVQVTSGLSAGTSGLSSVDYFISSQQLEQQQNPERFYSESLICLRHLPGFLPLRLSVLEQPARSEYGLPAQGRLYLCPQQLFKLHPDFDAVLALILERDSTGHLVLQSRPDIDGQVFYRQWLTRFERLYPELLPRIWCLPEMSQTDFLGLLQMADLVLDPFYVGGGRLTLEAFALGVPVITWPGERAAGRLAYALYQMLGILDCVAYNPSDYVEKALAIAGNPAYRERLSAALQAGRDRIFEQQVAVEELAACLSELVRDQGLHGSVAEINIETPGSSHPLA